MKSILKLAILLCSIDTVLDFALPDSVGSLHNIASAVEMKTISPIDRMKLREIASIYRDRPTVEMTYTLTQESDTHQPMSGEFTLLFDSERSFLEGDISLSFAENDSLNAGIGSWHWNGHYMKTFNKGAFNGRVEGVYSEMPSAQIVKMFYGITSEGLSWPLRFEKGDGEYSVRTGDDGNHIIVSEVYGDFPNETLYETTFSKQRGYAITQYDYKFMDPDTQNETLVSSFSFSEFKEINGLYVPFIMSKTVNGQHFDIFDSITRLEVKEVNVGLPEHEARLSEFHFPKGASIYDHILGRSMEIGVNSDEMEEELVTLISNLRKFEANDNTQLDDDSEQSRPSEDTMREVTSDVPSKFVLAGILLIGFSLVATLLLKRARR